MNGFGRNFLFWALIIFGALVLYQAFQPAQPSANEPVTYSQFLNQAEAGSLTNVRIQNDTLIGTLSNGETIETTKPDDGELIPTLRAAGVDIEVKKPEEDMPFLLSVLISWFPMLLLIAVWIFFMRQMQGGGRAMTFGKSRAQLLTENHPRVTFNDVAGVEEAKQDLTEVVDFLKDPGRFQKLGGRIPKGLLLVGPPGTGKTLLARSVAGEAGVPFFSISGSDFVEMFVGVGAARVRDLFEQGKKNAPCIIFIDEIDAVGRHRGAGVGGGNDEREQTLNALLVEMDGFESTEGVILIAATNRPDVLDPALMRPGRFDRQVVVPLPDIKGREMILSVHMNKVPLAANVDAEVLARGTPGFSGADLSNLVNEAALMAARHNKRLVDMEDFEAAKDKVMMGAERRSAVMTEEQKRTTAYHEAGHAIVTLFLDGPKDPLHKVTIIPRGRALGVTMSLPEEDKVTYDKRYLENQLAILFGGRLAEEIVLDQMTTGASNDIERATDIARKMVTSWGMSKLGPQAFGGNEESVFLGRELTTHQHMAESTAARVDAEIQGFITRNYERAKEAITKNTKKLHQLAEALLEHETLDKSQIDDLFAGRPIAVKKSRRAERRKGEDKKANGEDTQNGEAEAAVKAGDEGKPGKGASSSGGKGAGKSGGKSGSARKKTPRDKEGVDKPESSS